MDPEIFKTQERIKYVQERIDIAASSVNRESSEIELIAVTKQKSAAAIKSLVECGITKIGESYLKEALFKQQLLGDFHIEWHMIGTIQRGKEKQVAHNFDKIHSVDRVGLAAELNKWAAQKGKLIPIYLEYNISGEGTKHGWAANQEDSWFQLVPEMEDISNMQSLKIMGLMTMAPFSDDPEKARPCFVKLRKLRDFLNDQIPDAGFIGLSMGMSGDFETAIQEGATILRIGSALVGPR